MKIHNGHVLGSTAFLVCGLGVFAPLAFSPLIGVAALAATVLHLRRFGEWPRPPLSIVVVSAALLLLGALSAIWSIDSGETWIRVSRAVPLFVAGALLIGAARRLSQEEIRVFVRLFVAGATLALCLLLVERVAGGPIRHLIEPELEPTLIPISYNRGASTIALWAWPLAAIAWRWKPPLAAALWLAVLSLLAALENASAILALVLGAVACAAAYFAPRKAPAAVACICAALIVAAPLLPRLMPAPKDVLETVDELPRSGYHRLLIWRFTADRIAERPLLGWGLRASREMPGREIMLDKTEAALPLHPHNGVLQIWLELGVPGALLAVAFAGALLSLIGRSEAPVPARAAATAMSVSALTMLCLSYGIWQSWWLAALWMTAAFMVAVVRPEAKVARPAPEFAPARS